MSSKITSDTFIKFLNKENGKYVSLRNFEYKLGENIDSRKFNPFGSCEGGGLYYTKVENSHKYLKYGDHIAIIEIPRDAKTYVDPCGTKFKADKIIIKNFMPISEFIESQYHNISWSIE